MGLTDLMSFVPGPLGPIMKLVTDIAPKLFGSMGMPTSIPNVGVLNNVKEFAQPAIGGLGAQIPAFLKQFMRSAGQDSSIHLA